MFQGVQNLSDGKSKRENDGVDLDDIGKMSVEDILRDLKNYADGERMGVSISTPELQRRHILRNQAAYLYSDLAARGKLYINR